MCDAARGIVMMDRFGLPNAKTSLEDVARSGFYGELWRDVLDDDERAMRHRLPKGHLAGLIWRAMEAVRLRGDPVKEIYDTEMKRRAGLL